MVVFIGNTAECVNKRLQQVRLKERKVHYCHSGRKNTYLKDPVSRYNKKRSQNNRLVSQNISR